MRIFIILFDVNNKSVQIQNLTQICKIKLNCHHDKSILKKLDNDYLTISVGNKSLNFIGIYT